MDEHATLKRKHCDLSDVPKVPCPVDSLKDLPFIPSKPLPIKSFAIYIVGAPGSGKTNLWQAMMIQKKPLYYRGYFDRVELVSGSLGTLAPKVIKLLPKRNQHNQLTDKLITSLIDDMWGVIPESVQKSPWHQLTKPPPVQNKNSLIILDDVIKQISRSKVLSQIFLNRRHCTHNPENEGEGGLSLMVTSQKYNLLPLEFRNACDHVILFKTANASELRAIRDELMQDLSKEDQERVFEEAWRDKHSFLMIKVNAPKEEKYYVKFDSIQI